MLHYDKIYLSERINIAITVKNVFFVTIQFLILSLNFKIRLVMMVMV